MPEVPSIFNNLDSKAAYQRGLDYQREMFKAAKHENDYDSMCDAIENLKSEIKDRSKRKNYGEKVAKIEKMTSWYRTKESQYIRNTPDGKRIMYPPDIHVKCNKVLTRAYEMVMELLENLDLL